MLTKSQRRTVRGEIQNLQDITDGLTSYIVASKSAKQFLYRQKLISGLTVWARIAPHFFDEVFE